MEIHDFFIPVIAFPGFILMGWTSLCLHVITYDDSSLEMNYYISKLHPVLKYIYTPIGGDKVQDTPEKLKSRLTFYRLLLLVLVVAYSWPGYELRTGKLATSEGVFTYFIVSIMLIIMYILFFNVKPKSGLR